MKRNIPALVLALALALSLAACGRSEETAASAQPTAAADKAGNITLCLRKRVEVCRWEAVYSLKNR